MRFPHETMRQEDCDMTAPRTSYYQHNVHSGATALHKRLAVLETSWQPSIMLDRQTDIDFLNNGFPVDSSAASL